MSERKLKIVDFFFKNLPTMYKDMLGCFNECTCKRLIDISELSNATIMK